MRSGLVVLVAALLVGSGFAQQGAPATPVENPYQGDLPFVAGQPVSLGVVVEGVRLDALTVTPRQQPVAGSPVSCDVVFTGSGVGERKATASIVLLLEDAGGRGLERLVLDGFKIKPGRDFQEAQRRDVDGGALLAAARVYILAQVTL